MKRLKIAVVVGGFPQISETFVLNHIVGLLKEQHEVTIFATGINSETLSHELVDKYKLLEKVEVRPNPHVSFPHRLLKVIGLLWSNRSKFFTLLKTFKPKYYGSFALKGYFFFEAIPFLKRKPYYFDIIHAHFGENGNKVAYLKELGIIKSKLVVHFHGHDVNHLSLVKKQNNYVALEKYAQGIIFNSNYLLNKYKKITNSEIPSYQIPVGVDTRFFQSKTQYQITDRIKFITVARLVECKGIKLVIEALSKLNPANYEYNVIGDGPLLEEIRDSIKEGHHQSVHFHGALKHDQVYKHLLKNDVFVLFGITDSNGEIDAQGLVVQEAQSTGLPVIVSDGGGLPEGVIDGSTGFVVKEGNIDELREVLSKFVSKKVIIEKMGTNGADYCREKYDQEIINARVLDVYNTILS